MPSAPIQRVVQQAGKIILFTTKLAPTAPSGDA